MRGPEGGLRRRVAAVADVMRSPDLRRLQLAWAAYYLDDGMAVVALSVWPALLTSVLL